MCLRALLSALPLLTCITDVHYAIVLQVRLVCKYRGLKDEVVQALTSLNPIQLIVHDNCL